MMEDDAKRFLKKIVSTLSTAILWLLINMTWGLYLGWMIVEDHIRTGNVIFYVWFVISLAALLFYFSKLWGSKN